MWIASVRIILFVIFAVFTLTLILLVFNSILFFAMFKVKLITNININVF